MTATTTRSTVRDVMTSDVRTVRDDTATTRGEVNDRHRHRVLCGVLELERRPVGLTHETHPAAGRGHPTAVLAHELDRQHAFERLAIGHNVGDALLR